MFWFAPRWKKVFQDLFHNKTRTLLTLLSIAVGAFAVGVINTYAVIEQSDSQADFESANPASARIYTSPFNDNLLSSIREINGVAAAEGRSTASGQWVTAARQNTPIFITALPHTTVKSRINQGLNRLNYEGSASQLDKKEIFLERSASPIPINPGDPVSIELPDGHIKTLYFKGYVHDATTIPYQFSATVQGYVSSDTMDWINSSSGYSMLIFSVTEDKTSEKHVSDVANTISDRLKKAGVLVYSIDDYSPGRFYANDLIGGMLVIFNLLGWLTVGLSVFLVVNTMNTLIGQHIRQIGVMKSIGGSTLQIMGMYLVLILIFGFLSFLIAAPLASILGYRVSQFSAGYINFDLQPFRVVSQALWLEILIAFLAPLTSALLPVWRGVHLTVREAISNYGLGQEGQLGRGLVDHLFEKMRFLSRPMTISLRNTIRRKDRLILTLLALTLGGAIFMAVINLQDSMRVMIQQSEGYQPADVTVRLAQNFRIEKIQNTVMNVPGIIKFEGWKTAFGQLASVEENSQVGITFYASPPNSTLINPILLSGRWLMPEDQNALVIGYSLIKERPGLKVGDQIIIKINNKNLPFYVIGVYKMWATSSSPVVYVNSKYLDQITDSTGQISELRFTTTKADLATEELVVQNIQDRFKKESLTISSMQTGVDLHQQNLSQSMVLIIFMALMALLISLVGGLGLMGTMGMNVMERTREIGIMRAIGASSREIQGMVIMEGILIGLVSWVLSIAVSIPITLALNYGVGASILNGPLDFCFEFQGPLDWLLGVILIAAFSCLLPAWKASRFTIRETLAYE